MKYFAFVFVFVLFSCRKNTDSNNNNNNQNENIPEAMPVNTNIMAYTIGDNFQNDKALIFTTNSKEYNFLNPFVAFDLDNITTDGFKTAISVYSTTGTVGKTDKVFTVTNSAKNYVNVKWVDFPLLTYINNPTIDSNVINLFNGAQLVVPPNSFSGLNGNNVRLATALYTPLVPGYIVSLPCYPMIDEDGKRQYMSSIGVYDFQAVVELNGNTDVMLKFPVPADLLTTAPDSISMWCFNKTTNNAWKKSGYAHKKGNTYEYKINSLGFWSLAIPVAGIYGTLHLKNEQGAPVANTRCVLKVKGAEVADVRTDADGNALVFVPKGADLTIDVINDHFYNWANIFLIDQPLGALGTKTELTFVIPGRQDLVAIDAQVFNCDGSPLSEGFAVLSGDMAKDDYKLPIKNGKLLASNWINYAYNYDKLTIYDKSGTQLSDNTIAFGSFFSTAPKRYNTNLYSCKSAPFVYCNYTLDDSLYKVTAGASDPAAKVKFTSIENTFATVTVTNGNASFSITFSGAWASPAPVVALIDPTSLKINGAQGTILESQVEVLITRMDAEANGFAEGQMDIKYTLSDNKTHELKGNFRVKKMQ